MRTICCVCKKTKSRNGWVMESITRKGNLSHGYCPDCYRRTMQKFQISSPAPRTTGSGRFLNLG